MIVVNLQNITSATVQAYPAGQFHAGFSTVTLSCEGNSTAVLFVTAAQAETIAAVFSPKVNEAGIPVFEKTIQEEVI